MLQSEYQYPWLLSTLRSFVKVKQAIFDEDFVTQRKCVAVIQGTGNTVT